MPPARTPRPVPLRALVISLASLAVPVLAVLALPGWGQEDQGVLIWLTCLVPAFLLAYYRGLRGVALALAGGMAVLALTQVIVLLLGKTSPNWAFLLGVVAAYVGVCIGLAVFAEVLHRERRAAEEMALVDALTGLPNRRHAEVILASQFAASVRGRPLTVVLFDLDHFKQVNDRHGHEAGDRALQAFADVLRRSTRRMDLSARFGGEEFISILSTGVEDALIFADRVRAEIKGHAFPWGHVTVSAGASSYQDGMGSHEVLVAAADRALYAAKRSGRDRVAAAAQVPAEKPSTAPGRAAAPEGPAPRGTESVLVIDDDPDVLRFVAKVLRGTGYRVEETDDPERVILRYQDGQAAVDLLVTDIMMPKMNGLSLVDRIASVRPDIRVVYMSGHLQRDVSWAGFPGGAVGFVAKPINVAELLTSVREVLDQRPATTVQGVEAQSA